MAAFIEKHRKHIFWFILAVAFLMIYAYNLLTPYYSDDYIYKIEVDKAASLWDLMKQQYAEYLSNSGRIIGQFNIRLSLVYSKQLFNIVNSGMFIALVLLMYKNIRRKKKHDLFVLLLILTFLWRFAVSFGQTMLWLCGSCNYLWGSVIILGFITWYRHFLEHPERIRNSAIMAAAAFFFGLAAGWCNENTSGGGLILIVLFALNYRWKNAGGKIFSEKKEKRRIWKPFMITGILGMLCGMIGMVSAPGVRKRGETLAEGSYTGIVGLLSRIYKVTVSIRELFFTVLIILVIVLILLNLQKKLNTWKQIRSSEVLLFTVSAAAIAYALVLVATAEDRAFFGAGIFLFIACIQGIVDIADNETFVRLMKYGLVGILCLWLSFTYLENLVNLARIYREDVERTNLILAEKSDPEGDGIVVIPRYREAFANPYSNAHVSDLEDDKDYWINIFFEVYYDVGNITAIPRDEWDELYGNGE